jgi:hypothetical protein
VLVNFKRQKTAGLNPAARKTKLVTSP